MKIIEALKDFPVIEKRIDSNLEKISKYASGVEVPGVSLGTSFATVAEQEKELASLLQANEDLVKRHAQLRRWLYITNATVEVEILGETKTIAEWIDYREKGFNLLERTYNTLTVVNGKQEYSAVRPDATAGARVVKFYSEKDKNARIEEIQAMRDAINSRLEIVNATTDLLESLPIISPRG